MGIHPCIFYNMRIEINTYHNEFMKKIIALIILCALFSDAYAKGQRRLDTTPNMNDEQDEVTLQVEGNYYHIPDSFNQTTGNPNPTDTYYINATLDYSLTTGTDIQLATYNCPLAGGGAQNYECDSYVNLSQTFNITKHWSFLLGSQNGTVFASPSQWHNADYGLFVVQNKLVNFHAGTYFVDKTLATTTNSVEFTAGFQLDFDNGFMVQSDYFSGHNNLSGAQWNVFYKQYYIGVVVPEHNSGNEFAGVVGFKFNLTKLFGTGHL